MLVLAVWFLGFFLPGHAWAQPQVPVDPQQLQWWNRDIVTFRATLAEATPQTRAERALQQLKAISDLEMEGRFSFVKFTYRDPAGAQFLLDDRPLFAVIEADLEVNGRSEGLEVTAIDIVGRLETARSAWKESRSISVLITGASKSLAILAVGMVAISLIGRARRHLTG